MKLPKRGIFVAGTNTEVGKTRIACGLIRYLRDTGVRVGAYKPVASGCQRVGDQLVSDDAVQMWEAAGRPLDLELVCPQRFELPVAPYVAAEAESRQVRYEQVLAGIEPWSEFDVVVVESAGGLFSPLTPHSFSATLAANLGFPIVLVAANRLGVIHETVSALYAAKSFDPPLKINAVVLNDTTPGEEDSRTVESDPSRRGNFQELRRFCDGVPVFLNTRYNDVANLRTIDWLTFATLPNDAVC